MIYIDVDAAVVVPVNVMPLLDDTDFKSREVAIAYNAAGMDLVWNFVTTAGVVTQTAVTPTTAGNYDWAHAGDGMYTIEIPASGGVSINNDTEGVGYFSGICTGVLPWRGPDICFRAAGLNNVLIDSAYSTTRGLGGTALPDAAAAASGGLPTVNANNRVQAMVMRWLTDDAAGTPAALSASGYLQTMLLRWLTDNVAGTPDALDANGGVNANLQSILATMVTEGGAGRLAAAFTKFLDVVGPALTTASVNQTGDAYAVTNGRLPAALTAGGNIKADLKGILETVLTETVGGYLAAGFKKFFDVAVPLTVADKALLSAADVNAEVDAAFNTAIPASPTSGSVNDYLARLSALVPWVSQSTVQASPVPTTTSFALDGPMTVDSYDLLSGAMLVFTSGALGGIGRQVATYDGSTLVVTLDRALPAAPVAGVTCRVFLAPANVIGKVLAVAAGTITGTGARVVDASGNNVAPASTALSTATWTATRAGYLDNLSAGAAALASVCTEARLAELAAANLPADVDTLLTRLSALRAGYLDNLSAGAVALASVCTEARLAELAAANLPADVDTLLTRITAAVALASVCTETRLAELDAANLPADVAAVKTDTTAILLDTSTDGVVVATASKTGYALSAAAITAILDTSIAGAVTANTVREALRAARVQGYGKFSISGDTLTVYEADGVTAAKTFTLAPAGGPYTSRTPV